MPQLPVKAELKTLVGLLALVAFCTSWEKSVELARPACKVTQGLTKGLAGLALDNGAGGGLPPKIGTVEGVVKESDIRQESEARLLHPKAHSQAFLLI